MGSTTDGKQPDKMDRVGANAKPGRHDTDRDAVPPGLKSGQFDPSTAHQPQELRKHPTEGERMHLGDVTPGVVAEDEDVLPDKGKPVPESLSRGDGDHGVLDPAEAGHPLPEGLERKRAGSLNKETGRRSEGRG